MLHKDHAHTNLDQEQHNSLLNRREHRERVL